MNDVRVAAVVVAARGGDRIARALEQAAWAEERLVLDPTGVVDPAALPRGVAHVAAPSDLAAAATAEWLVLLREDEVADPTALARARATLAAAPAGTVYALPLVARTIGLEVTARRGRPSIARRGTPLAVARGTMVAFSVAGGRERPLPVTVHQDRGDSLNEALEALGADATVDAALADQLGAPARAGAVACRALAALGRSLVARARARRLGHGRWVLAVLDAYRVVVTAAKLWERRRDHLVELV